MLVISFHTNLRVGCRIDYLNKIPIIRVDHGLVQLALSRLYCTKCDQQLIIFWGEEVFSLFEGDGGTCRTVHVWMPIGIVKKVYWKECVEMLLCGK